MIVKLLVGGDCFIRDLGRWKSSIPSKDEDFQRYRELELAILVCAEDIFEGAMDVLSVQPLEGAGNYKVRCRYIVPPGKEETFLVKITRENE